MLHNYMFRPFFKAIFRLYPLSLESNAPWWCCYNLHTFIATFEKYFLTKTRTTKKWLFLFNIRIVCDMKSKSFVPFFLFPIFFPFCHAYFHFSWEVCITCIVSQAVRRGLEEWFAEICTAIAHLMMVWHSTRIAECLTFLPWTLCADIQTHDIWWWRRQVTHQSNATRKVAPRVV